MPIPMPIAMTTPTPRRVRPAPRARAFARVCALALATTLASPPLWAQAAAPALAKTADTAAPAVAFERWLRVLEVVPAPAPAATVVVVSAPATATPAPAAPAAAQAVAYEPWPVVLGQPELPVSGGFDPAQPRLWPEGANYQGLHVSLVAVDAQGRRQPARPLSAAPRPGERFKLRVVATFDGVAQVGTVAGQGWALRRGPALYPAASAAPLRLKAGQALELPAEPNHHFVVAASGADRLLLSVREERADEATRSRQPAYRQDRAEGSSYLQLVPAGTRPAFEQLINAAR